MANRSEIILHKEDEDISYLELADDVGGRTWLSRLQKNGKFYVVQIVVGWKPVEY